MASTFDTTAIDAQICSLDNLKYTASAAGAAVAYFGLDRLLPLPTEVHYGLAGLIIAAHCQNGLMAMPTMDELSSPMSMSAIVYGIVGGVAFTFIRPRLGI